MGVVKKIKKLITDKDYRFKVKVKYGLLKRMDDEKYLKRMFHAKMGYDLDLENPKTFNEKLQWLKLHDRKPIYTTMVDKYAVKKYVADKIGKEYVIPTIGTYSTVDKIDFDKLPDRFVLKCTHDSHGLVICKNKSKLNVEAAKKKLNKSLKSNYYYKFREWPYKKVKPRIIAEEYMEEKNSDGRDNGLTDYKVHCFGGKPNFILVCRDRYAKGGMSQDFYTCDWKHMELKRPDHSNSAVSLEKPEQLNKMIELTEKLASGIPFVRVDWYIIKGKLYFGEITFYPASGFKRFQPESEDMRLGELIDII